LTQALAATFSVSIVSPRFVCRYRLLLLHFVTRQESCCCWAGWGTLTSDQLLLFKRITHPSFSSSRFSLGSSAFTGTTRHHVLP
jgi:hypothetical protein